MYFDIVEISVLQTAYILFQQHHVSTFTVIHYIKNNNSNIFFKYGNSVLGKTTQVILSENIY